MNIGDRKTRPVSPDEIHEIFADKKPIAQDTAQAIGKALSTSSRLWLDLQSNVDI